MREIVERCYMCGDEASLTSAERSISIGRRSVVVEEEFMRCAKCGEEFYSPAQMDLSQRRASAKIREEEGLLQPEAIKAIRENLGLSQAAFETLIGAGAKTVVRWEKGTVFQNKTADALLRVLRDYPAVAESLATQRGLDIRVGAEVRQRLHGLVLQDAERALANDDFAQQTVVYLGSKVRLELDQSNQLFSSAA